jgi:hypothetical protein
LCSFVFFVGQSIAWFRLSADERLRPTGSQRTRARWRRNLESNESGGGAIVRAHARIKAEHEQIVAVIFARGREGGFERGVAPGPGRGLKTTRAAGRRRTGGFIRVFHGGKASGFSLRPIHREAKKKPLRCDTGGAKSCERSEPPRRACGCDYHGQTGGNGGDGNADGFHDLPGKSPSESHVSSKKPGEVFPRITRMAAN